MQISALSTIIAAQQARSPAPARPATNTPPAAKPAAAPAVAPSEDDFAPLSFAAPASAMTATADAPARPAYSAGAPLGSQVDIRV
jgi:hypothetical protein